MARSKIKHRKLRLRAASVRCLFVFVCFAFLYYNPNRTQSPRAIETLQKSDTVSISYVYRETTAATYGEILRKRLNLYAFLKYGYCKHAAVDYTFHVSGRLPSADEFYSSIRKQPLHGEQLFPAQVKVLSNHQDQSDLCQHTVTMKDNVYSFYIFLNDGTLGPVLKQPALSCSANSTTNLPFWIRKVLILFESRHHAIAAVGATYSCEKHLHLQTNFIAISHQAAIITRRRWKHLCVNTLSWDETIERGEIGLSREFLRNRFSLCDIECGRVKEINNSFLKPDERIQACTNPSLQQFDINKRLMIKYGGEVWRRNLIHSSVRQQVTRWERNI